MSGLLSAATLWGLASETLGAFLAAALIVVLLLTLPRGERGRVGFPAVAFALHLATFAAGRAFADGTEPRRVCTSVSAVLLLASIARALVLVFADVVMTHRLKRPLPKISRDIAQGLAYTGVALIALRELGVEPGSLLTTSALLTAVIGLSLQETLGNLFAGIAIQAQRPFVVGDWIQFDADPKHIGRVVEMNWRATKVITLDDVEVIVPNATLAKAPITNFTQPTLASRRSIYVVAPYDVPPGEVAEVVLEALAGAPGVVASPKPSVVTNQFVERGIEYWVRFFTDQFHLRDGVDGGVRDRIWYAFARSGIRMPVPSAAVELREITSSVEASRRDVRREERARVLRGVDLFDALSDDDLATLAASSRERLFAKGETVVREGDAGGELFVVERGEVSVSVARGQGKTPREVARLDAGKFFGEMALLTGDGRHATVRASTSCRLVEVSSVALKPLLESTPDLAMRLSELLARRQADLDARAAEHDGNEEDLQARTSQLFDRVRRFFSLQ